MYVLCTHYTRLIKAISLNIFFQHFHRYKQQGDSNEYTHYFKEDEKDISKSFAFAS